MPRMLGHPAACVALTALVVAWPVAHTKWVDPVYTKPAKRFTEPSAAHSVYTQHRPLHQFLARTLNPDKPRSPLHTSRGSDPGEDVLITPLGPVRHWHGLTETYKQSHKVIASTTITTDANVDEIGLLAPVITRRRVTLNQHPHPNSPPVSLDLISSIYSDDLPKYATPFKKGTHTQWAISLPALANDALYFATLLTWLLSLIAFPTWLRRRRHSLCPQCQYPTIGLATPTCPECGSQIPPSPLGGEGARAAGG